MNPDYKILREIGRGGMAVVYLAKNIHSQQLAAIKVLKTDSGSDHEYIRRFFREARITAQLQHPHIIRVLESNYSDGNFYIITEFMDGGDFYRLQRQPGVSRRQKLEIILKVMDALDYAHRQGIVHRDVKPSNILLSAALEPKLCDFGIATALWGQETRLTQTFASIGTVDYIAPEQKENSKNVDFRADIYALGVILYEIITGRRPQGAFPLPSEIDPDSPAALDDLILKCLQPWPHKRFKSTRNLHDELADILRRLKSTQPPPSSSSPSPHAPPETVYSPPPPEPDDRTMIKTDHITHFRDLIAKIKEGGLTQKIIHKKNLLQFADQRHEDELLHLIPLSDGFLKETLIETLGKIKSSKSCPILIELLNDPYYNKPAAAAIGEIGCKEAEYKLFNILISGGANAYIALIPLGKLNSLRSVKEMQRFLKSPHQWVRETALDALALINPITSVRQYIEETAKVDDNAEVRARAKKILWRFRQ